MPTLLSHPMRVQQPGDKAKLIDEYIGHLNANNEAVGIAHIFPKGRQKPRRTPECVRCSTPEPDSAEAFLDESVHREDL